MNINEKIKYIKENRLHGDNKKVMEHVPCSADLITKVLAGNEFRGEKSARIISEFIRIITERKENEIQESQTIKKISDEN